MNTDFLFLQTQTPCALKGFGRRLAVSDHECVLLYRHGRFLRRLDAGRHRLWGTGHAIHRVDLRKATLTLSGQEVLTADNVGLKISLALTWQISDPVKALHEVQNWHDSLYQTVQLTLRSVIAAQTSETLLEKRLEIGAQLHANAAPEAEKIGITLSALAVKDVMLPADLKKLFSEVLKAKQEGIAALERARGETAALRNLANAAKMLEGNPSLQNLRLLQTMAAAGQSGSTFVWGLSNGFVPALKDSDRSRPQVDTRTT
jgi:regulator of protease activity HflC (stomatin/prohibitin superfamily)